MLGTPAVMDSEPAFDLIGYAGVIAVGEAFASEHVDDVTDVSHTVLYANKGTRYFRPVSHVDVLLIAIF
jgi:hypothetical protein